MKQEILTHYGKVQIPNTRPNEAEIGGPSPFRTNTRYINNTRKIVRAQLRSGLELSIPAVNPRSARANDNQMLVQHELVVSSSVAELMRNYFLALSNDITGALVLFRDVYLKVFNNVYQMGKDRDMRCTIEYTFTEKDLLTANSIFYHDELDTVFKFGDEPFKYPHPHTQLGRKLEAEEAAAGVQEKYGFVFWIEIIDNLGKYGDRYVSICNEIYKIIARTDKNRPDGLYIVSSKPTNGKINPDGIATKYYPFEAIEKDLGIYLTYELASSNGDIAAMRKRELVDLEHSIAVERQTFQREKIHFETELDEKNRRLKDLEYERGLNARSMDDLKSRTEYLIEMERIRSKESYERRSNDRRDASEFVKFLPTILTAIGTILMAYKAFRTGS